MPVTRAVLTCPECRAQVEEEMHVDACRVQYECMTCGLVMRPRPGTDCVFCSYGDVPCPDRQARPGGAGTA